MGLPQGPARLAALVAAAALAAGCGDDETTTPTTTQTDENTVTRTQTDSRSETGTQTTTAGRGDGDRGVSNCGNVAYQPNTDAGAFDIVARNVSCDTARAVARAAEGVRERRYTSNGFTCRGERQGGQLPRTEWNCARDDAGIDFVSS